MSIFGIESHKTASSGPRGGGGYGTFKMMKFTVYSSTSLCLGTPQSQPKHRSQKSSLLADVTCDISPVPSPRAGL